MVKILILKISSAGDILHSTAILTGLKRYFDEKNIYASIDFVIDPQYIDLVKNLNIVNQFYLYDELKYKRLLKEIVRKPYLIFKNIYLIFNEIYKNIKEINKNSYDYIFDLQGIEKSLIFYFFSKGKNKNCKWSLPYKYLNQNKTSHAIDAMAFVIKKYFKDFSPYKITININESEIEKEIIFKINEIGDFDFKKNNYIVISPYSRWDTKNLPLIYYLLLSYYINLNYNFNILFIGSKLDRLNFNNFIFKTISKKEKFIEEYYSSEIVIAKTNEFLNKMLEIDLNHFIKILENSTNSKDPYRIINKNIYNFNGFFSLKEIPYIIKYCNLFVGSDSMNLFIADSQEKKIIAFFGPTNPLRSSPYNIRNSENLYIYQNENLYCIKCNKRKCNKKGVFYKKCLYDIDFDILIEKINFFLKN